MEKQIHIVGLVWDDWNRADVLHHGLSQLDAEAILMGRFVAFETYKNRVLLLGPGRDERLIVLVIGQVPGQPGYFYPFSLRPASRRERALYSRTTGPEIDHGHTT